MRELSQNVQAVQKRKYRTVQREKRRRSFFIHDYIRTKYPGIFNEANSMYQMFVEKYPSKPDFTKSYYFKKWQRKIDQTKTCLMIPHLPILASPTTLQQRATVQQPEEQATVQQSEEQATVQQPEEQATVQQPEEQGTVQQPEEQGTHDETTIQFNEEVIDSDVQDQTDQFVQMSLSIGLSIISWHRYKTTKSYEIYSLSVTCRRTSGKRNLLFRTMFWKTNSCGKKHSFLNNLNISFFKSGTVFTSFLYIVHSF